MGNKDLAPLKTAQGNVSVERKTNLKHWQNERASLNSAALLSNGILVQQTETFANKHAT